MSKLMKGRAVTIGVVVVTLLISAAAYFLLSRAPGKVYSSPTDVDITSNTTWSGNTTVYGTLTVKSGYTLTIDSSGGTQVTVTADNLVVESGAYISANGKGSAGGAATVDGTGSGKGLAGSASMAGGGAGYGGAGGDGYGNVSSGGAAYGSNTAPTANGSGGGGGATDAGGAGGGAIKFVIANETTVSGTISANGANGAGATNGSGAGSGGSIYLTTTVLSGSGSITANGGNGVANSGGLGGGGRVALYYYDKSNFSGTVSANKGTTGNGSGANGTSFDSPSSVAIYTGGAGTGYIVGTGYFYYGNTTTSIWDGGGADNLASTAANWVGDTLPIDGNSIIFNDTSTKNCTWDLLISPANFTLDTGYGPGTVTLNQDLTVTNTITINTNSGTLVDNGKNVNFKNASIVKEASRLTSTGAWKMTASGNITGPYSLSGFNSLELAASVTATLTGDIYTKKLILGNNSTVTGNYTLGIYYPSANNFVTQGTGTTVSSTLEFYGLTNNLTQGALTTAGNVKYSNDNHTITMLGNWSVGGWMSISGVSSSATPATLDTNGYNLTVGSYLKLAASSSSAAGYYTGKILFKSGTHTITGNLYVDAGSGAAGGTCYTHGWIDLGSGTVNVGGDVDFRGASVTIGTSTVNLTTTTTANIYSVVDYTYKDATLDTAAVLTTAPFYKLTSTAAGKIVNFEASKTVTIANNLSFAGASANPLTLNSTTAGTAANLSVAGTATGMNYLNVAYCNASSGKTNVVTHNSTDSLNNSFWTFAGTGTNYWINASADGKWSTAANWSTGAVPGASDSVFFTLATAGGCTMDVVGGTTVANLTLNTGYINTALTLGANLTTSGSLTITQGTIDAAGYNVTVGGNLVSSGSLFRTLNLGTGTWSVAGDWNTPGSNITIVPSTSTVNLTGTGKLITTNTDSDTFYNLSCAASTKTTTIDSTSAAVEAYIRNVLTLGGGTLAKTGSNSATLTLLNTVTATTTPLVLNSSTINSGVIIKFMPITARTVNIPGGSYGSGTIEAYAKTNSTLFQLTGNITAAGAINLYAASPAAFSQSVSRANIRLSRLAGTAFVDFSQPSSLTPYVGKYLVVKGSAGTKIKGWIKAAGTGETYGSEVSRDSGFDNSSMWGRIDSGWTVNKGNNSKVIATSVAASTYTYDNLSTTQEALYRILVNVDSVYQWLSVYLDGNVLTPAFSSPGARTLYVCSTTGGARVIGFGNNNAGFSLSATDYSAKQVLTPSASGVTIVDTQGGINYNWAVLEAGFNRNDSSGYTYTIYDNASETAPTAISSTVNFNNMNVTTGALTLGKDANTAGAVTLNAGNGAITFTTTSGLSAASNAGSHTLNMGTSTWTMLGGWNLANGTGLITMNAENSTVNFGGVAADIAAISGNNTFYNLNSTVAGKTIQLQAGTTLTVSGNLTLQGASGTGNLLNLNSSTAGTAANLTVTGTALNMKYLNVQDSNASGGKTILAHNSTGVSNNTNWSFAAAGTVYWTNASGDGKWSTASNWSNGVVPLSTDSVYFSSISSTSNCSIDTAASVANLTLDTGYTGAVTLASTYNLATSANLTITQGTLNAGTSNVTVGSNLTSNGSLTRTLTLGTGTWSVAGNWDTTGSNITITPSTSTVTLTGTGTFKTNPTTSFYNLSLAASTKTTTIARDPTKNTWVAVGESTNTIAYSSDGTNWTGLGTSIFSTNGIGVCWNGSKFVAVGSGTNTIAYSSDGITWTGLGTSIFSTAGYGVAWNGSKFVAVGSGTNTIAYSSDGITWTAATGSTSIFSGYGNGVCWNGSKFVAVGSGTNTIAYSSDGITWTGLGTSIFSTSGLGVCWNGSKFVAVGNGATNTIAYSSDGITWTGRGTTIFSVNGYAVAWNGSRFVAVGNGTNSIAYSSDGITWTGRGLSTFSSYGRGICWDGSRFMAVGNGINSIAYSSDGITWTGLGAGPFSVRGIGVSSSALPKLTPPILSDDIPVINTLTLGGGTLARNSTDQVALTLRNTANTSLVLNSSSITNNPIIRFSPVASDVAKTVSIPGGNYGTAQLEAYAQLNNSITQPQGAISYQLSGNVTAANSLNIYADSGLSPTTTFSLNNYNLYNTTAGLLYIGKDAALGPVTFNAGSGSLTLAATPASSIVADNAGAHTLNMNSSTWNISGNWQPEGSTADTSSALTVVPGTSTLTFTGTGISTIYGSKAASPEIPLYNLYTSSGGLSGKTIKVNAGKTLQVGGILSLQGLSASDLLTFTSTSTSAFNLNILGSAANMNYLNVSYSNASGGKNVVAYNSTDSGNNTNWVFGTTGNVYWTNGSGDGLWSTANNWSTGVVPQATDNVYFNTSSTANCSVNQAATVANLTLDTGYTGTVTLSSTAGQNLTITNTITINTNGGTLVDNGRTVNFKNASIVNEAGHLTSTGYWKMTASGNISNSYSGTPLNSLELAALVTATLASDVYTKNVILGSGSAFTGNYTLVINDLTQGALTTAGDVAYTAANHTITMTGNWNVGGALSIYGLSASGSTATLDTNGYNLVVGSNLKLGYNDASSPNGHLGKILFKNGAHTITGKIYVDAGSGAAGGSCYTHGYIDLGSGTVNVGGDVDYRGASVTIGTSTVNLTTTTTANIYSIANYAYIDAVLDTALLSTAPFYKLTSTAAGKTINFEASKTVTIANNLTLAGASGNYLNLNSTTTDTAANLNIAGAATGLTYLNVKDSNASSGKAVVTRSSTSVSNNTNWVFGAAGAVYWTNGSGDGKWSTAANWSTGALPQATELAYFGAASTSNCTVDQNVTVAGLVTQSTYGGTISFGANTINIAGDCDLRYATVDLGTSVINITANNATFYYPGDLTLASNNELNMTAASGQTVVLPGSFTVATGSSFTPGTSTVKFTATSGTKIIDMVYNSAAPTLNKFYNLTFDGVGGTWQYKPTGSQAALQVANNFTVVNGTFDDSSTGTNKNITIAGNLVSSGSATRAIKFGVSTSWAITGGVNLSGSNLAADFGSSAITASGSWDSSGTNTFTVGTSAVNLNGTGSLKAGVGVDTFYNLTCAASTKTTTLDASSAIEPQIKNVLTLGGGTLTKTGANSATLTLTNGNANANPLVPGSTTIGSGVTLKFMPSAANIINIAGGNYGSGVIDAYAKLNAITFKLADNITGAGGVNLYADNTITTAVDLNNKNLSTAFLKFGKTANTGSVTLAAGSGAVTFTTTTGLSVDTDGGAHTINMGTSTWTVLGGWNLAGGTGLITMNPDNSTVIFSGPDDAIIRGNNNFYNLKCVTAGKHMYFEDAKTQGVTGNLIFAGASGSANLLLLNNISQTSPWLFNVQGQPTVAYVNVYNSNATSGKTIVASNSNDGTGNSNWTFSQSGTVYWTGTGTDNNWSNADNWSIVALPSATDDVIFNGNAVKNCTADVAINVKSLTLDTGYTGKLTLGANCTTANNFVVNQGTFDALTYNVTVGGDFTSSGAATRAITMGSGSWSVGGNWNTTGSNITLTASTAPLSMPANTLTMSSNNIIFNSLTFSGITSATITTGGDFNPGSFICATINPSIEFNATSAGKVFNPFGITFNNVTFSGAGGEWALSDNLSALGTITISAGKLIDSAKAVSFKNVSIVDEANRLVSTGTWSQSDTGTVTNPNASNKFKQLDITAATKTTTLGSDVNADVVNFSTGTLKGENKTITAKAAVNPIITDSATAFVALTKLNSLKADSIQSQQLFHLPNNLVNDAVEFYRSIGAIQATGNWDFANNTFRFYADPGATGKVALSNGVNNYNLTAGSVQLGSTAASGSAAYLSLGSGTHSIGSFAKAYSGTVTGSLNIEMAAATINNYSGNLDLSPLTTYTCGTSTINFGGSSGVKAITSGGKTLYNVSFNDADTEWQLQDNLSLKGSITLSSGIFNANSKNVTLTGQDIATINGDFTSANSSAFYDLTCTVAGKQINFAANKTVAVTHNFTITGASVNWVKLYSTVLGTRWNLNTSGANIILAQVRDSNAVTPITAIRSVDVSNNLNWQFSPIRAWNGLGTTNNWSEAANWEDGIAPSSDESVIFDVTSAKNCVVDVPVTVKDFIIDANYAGVVSIGQSSVGVDGSITSVDTLTINGGQLNDSGKNIFFHNLVIADTAGLISSTGTWAQNLTGSINSPNAGNKINNLIIAGTGVTTTLASDLHANKIDLTGSGTLNGQEKVINLYGSNGFISSGSSFTVGSTISTIKIHDCIAQGAFSLPNDLTSAPIDLHYNASGASASGAWNFGNNKVRFYSDSGTTRAVQMVTNNLTAGDIQIGSAASANNNATLNLGDGTHSIRSIAKAYPGTVTGSLSLQMGPSAINCPGNIDFTSISVDAGTSTLNLTGTLSQTLTTAGNSFYKVKFSGNGPFVIAGDLTTVNTEIIESKAIGCSGGFQVTSSFTPATSTITLNSTSAGNQLAIPLTSSFYNLTIDGIGGEWTLGNSMVVANTLTINNGKLIDNANAVTFKNLSIADKANLLTSTGTWTQSASGEIRCPNKLSRIKNLSICGTNIITTFTGNVAADKAIFGVGTLAGAAKNLYLYGSTNSIDCAAPFTINSSLFAIYTENHTSQNAFVLPNNLVTDSVYWRADAGILSATGAWNFANNSVTCYTTPQARKEIQLSSFALTCGNLKLGAADDGSYPAILNLGNGTHTVSSIGKAYNGATTDTLSLLGGSSTINCSGSIDLTGITFTPSTSSIAMQGGSGTRTILSVGQQLYNLNFNDADTSWSLRDTLSIQHNLTLTAGSFLHNNQKVAFTSANNSNITGGFTFYDLECLASGKILYFQANRVQTVQGTFRVTGSEGYNIKLYSLSSPTAWNIDAANSSVSYVNVKDCAAQKTIVPANSVDEGNNTGWIIGGRFIFSTPTVNSVLAVGTTQNLSWTTESGIVQAKLYYTTNASDNTPVWKPITVDPISVNPNGQVTSYAWVVPDDISTDCKVKIAAVVENQESANLFALSAGFKIMGALTLTYPTAEGVGWPVTSSKNISWATTGTINSVNIYSSTTGPVPVAPDTWRLIGQTGSNTYYSWNPSDTYGADFRSDNCYIKITDARYESLVYGISAYNFMLSAGSLDNLLVTTAQGQTKDVLTSGLSYQIRWDTGGTVANVDLAYSVDNGATWKDIAKAVTNDNRYDGVNDNGPWVIPHDLSNNVFVRVSDASKPALLAKSANIDIISPFMVTAPVAGNIWLGGSNYNITWQNSVGTAVNNVKIQYSTDSGTTWQEINNGIYTKTNDFSEPWTVAEISTNSAIVRVSDSTDTTGFAYADSDVFKIKRGTVSVISPNTQVSWKVGEVHEVEWAKTGDVTSVKLYYSANANDATPVWKDIVPAGAALSAGALKYAWTVPNDVSETCSVKVIDANDPQIADVSNATFKIKPNLTLNIPNGGQSWITGKLYNIVWATTGTIPKVNLHYSTDNGVTWNLITLTSIDNTGSYSWVIPENNVSSDCLVRVQSATDATTFSQSATKFAIALASINVSSPKAGDIWVKGDRSKEITWATDGTIYNNLTIEYSAIGDFTDAVEIASAQQNAGSYLWNIPDNITASTTAKIRVKDMTWAGKGFTVKGDSVAFETTNPRIDVTLPKASDRLVIGANFSVNWVARGTAISTVKIIYSPTADFVNDAHTIATGLTASSGTYTYTWKDAQGNWNAAIPLTVATAAKIRVIDEGNQTIYGDSGAVSLAGSFVITAPAAQTKFFVTKTANITWSTVGNIAQAKLSYSSNGNGAGAVWYNMSGLKAGDAGYAATVVANPGIGTYTWTIPDLTPTAHSPNTNVYIKIEDPLDALSFDTRQFTVSYYSVKWKVVDEAGLVGNLSSLIVEDTDVAANTLFERVSGLSSGAMLYYYPGKKYNSVWSRDAYLETAVSGWQAYDEGKVMLSDGTILDTLNASTPFVVKMPQKLITKVLKVEGSNYYDANSDVLAIQGWLMQQDTMIPKSDSSSGIDGISQGYIEIFDETNNSLTTSDLAVSSVLNQNGTFNVKWSGLRAAGKLLQGKNYFARLRLMYQGAYIWGVVPFQVSGALDIQAIQQGMGLRTGETIVTQMEKKLGVTGEGSETIAAKVQIVADKALSILTAAEKTLPDKITKMREEVTSSIKTEVKPFVQAGILTRDTTVKQGDSIDISYRTTTGLVPTVTVYDPKDRIRLNAKTMVEIGTTGVYVYSVKFLAAWGAGEFTVVCTEPTNGTVDALVMTVTQADLADVSGQVSAVLGSTTGLSGMKNVAENLTSQFSTIDTTLAKLSAGIAGKVQETAGALGSLSTVFTQLESISKQIKSMSGAAEGINLEKLYNVSKEKKDDVTYIKNKTQELKAAMDINQKLMQNAANKPVVQTWFEFK